MKAVSDTLAALGLTTASLAMIEAMADEVAEAKAAAKAGTGLGKRKGRKTITAAAWAEAEAGVLPEAPEFPLSNYYANRHAKALRDAAGAGDREGLVAYTIGGTNTYSKALRSYREALLRYLEVKGTMTIGVDLASGPDATVYALAYALVKPKPAKGSKKATGNATGAAA